MPNVICYTENDCAWSWLGPEFYYKISEFEYLNSKLERCYQRDVPKPDFFYLYFICSSSSVKSRFSESELFHILCKWNDIMVPIGSWVKLTSKEFNYIHYYMFVLPGSSSLKTTMMNLQIPIPISPSLAGGGNFAELKILLFKVFHRVISLDSELSGKAFWSLQLCWLLNSEPFSTMQLILTKCINFVFKLYGLATDING